MKIVRNRRQVDALIGRVILITAAVLLCAPSAHAIVDDKPQTRHEIAGGPNNEANAFRSAPPRQSTAKAAQKRLIVKYKDTVTQDAAYAYGKQQTLQSLTADRSDSLDQLYQKHGVRSVTPVFRDHNQAQLLSKSPTQVSLPSLRSAETQQKAAAAAKAPAGGALPELFHIYRLELSDTANVDSAVRDFQADAHVAYAQPDYEVTAFMTPNDPYYSTSNTWGQGYGDMWGLKKIQAGAAWDQAQGQGIVVAVVDTGVDYNHPDLAANMWTNTREIPSNGIDDDNNGYVDDIRGWDFAKKDNDPMDAYGHGTHVAGTIAAVGNNNVGVIGVAPKAKIMAVRGLDENGSGAISDLADGIVYAAQNGAKVINNSWGCGYCPSNPVAEDAVRTAMGLGVTVVFAAGNSGAEDLADRGPQNMTNPKPVVVSASDFWDRRTIFSSYGATVDVAAPGGGTVFDGPSASIRNILSLKSSVCNANMCPAVLTVGGQYVRQAGTSMAAPHIAGAAAVVLSKFPQYTPDQVRMALRNSADDLGKPGVDPEYGAGRLNLARAVGVSVAVPTVKVTAPVDGTTIHLNESQLTVSGTAAGSRFARYELAYASAGKPGQWTVFAQGTSPVVAGTIANWSVDELAIDSYVLRLLVTDTAGEKYGAIAQIALEPIFTTIPTDISQGITPNITGDIVRWYNGCSVMEWNRTTQAQKSYAFDQCPYLFPERGPAVSGNFLAYAGGPADYSVGSIISLRTISSGATRTLTPNGYLSWDPGMSGPWAIWHRQLVTDNPFRDIDDVLVYNTSTAQTTRLGISGYYQYYPSISGNRAVYMEGYMSFNGDPDVPYAMLVQDLSTGARQKLVAPGWEQEYGVPFDTKPTISGTKVIWETARYDDSIFQLVTDIYLFDLATNKGRWLTQNAAPEWYPTVSGNWVAWADYRTGDGNIFVSDLTTNTQRQITANPMHQILPSISNGRVVWQDDREIDAQNPYGTRIYMFSPPDLKVESIKFYRKGAPETPENEVTPVSGQTVIVKAILKNIGESESGIFRVRWLQDGIETASSKHPSLAAGQTSEDAAVRFEWQAYYTGAIPWSFEADTADRIPELSESNNQLTKTVTIFESADLTVTTVTASPIWVGGQTALSIVNTVKNQAPAGFATAINFQVAYSLRPFGTTGASDRALSVSRTVASLAPGAASSGTVSLKIPSDVPVGAYYVCSKADGADTIFETNEANNTVCTANPIQVSLPELGLGNAVSTTTGVSATVKAGASFAVYEAEYNSGEVLAGAYTVSFALRPFGTTQLIPLAATRSIASLAPRVTSQVVVTLTIPASTPGGRYDVCAISDSGNTVPELYEGNNTNCTNYQTSVYVTKPDLTVTVTLISTTGIGTGTPLSIWDTVKNIGPAGSAIPTNFKVAYYLTKQKDIVGPGDILLQTARTIASLPVGASSSAKTDSVVTTTTPAGTYWVCARVDEKLTIEEGNEANNVGCYPTPLNVN